MFKILPESSGRMLAVEILHTYSQNDIKAFEKLLEQKIAQAEGRLNILVRLDKVDLNKVPLENYIEDCRRTLDKRQNLERIAVVGDSRMAQSLVTMDNLIMANAKRGIVERYFDVSEIDKAWSFVRG